MDRQRNKERQKLKDRSIERQRKKERLKDK